MRDGSLRRGSRPPGFLRPALPAVAALGMVLLAAAGGGAQAAVDDGELLTRADSVRLYLPASPDLLLTEFVDFACSDCRAFHLQRADSLRTLLDDEGVAYAFRTYPIPRLLRGFHGAEAAFCAGGVAGRGAFRRMQTVLFERQAEWARSHDPEPLIRNYAREQGMGDAFDDCVRRNAVWPLIAMDTRQGTAMGIPGTPSFVLTRLGADAPADSFYGNQPMSRFREAIARARAGD
jgi:protein-disulfide isomerase